MPRIYSQMYQPYTYQELVAPLESSTQAHKEIEQQYENTLLTIDALRERANQEPDAPWAQNLIAYTNQLAGYAQDLLDRGLQDDGSTKNNLLNAKRRFAKEIVPVTEAISRQKDLQKIRDNNPGARNIFGQMPTLQTLIDNPMYNQSYYNGPEIFKTAKEAAEAANGRHDRQIPLQNINDFWAMYGEDRGYSDKEISQGIDRIDALKQIFNEIGGIYGYDYDDQLDKQQKNQIRNEIISGIKAGLTHDRKVSYVQRPDDPIYEYRREEAQWKAQKAKQDALAGQDGNAANKGLYDKLPKVKNASDGLFYNAEINAVKTVRKAVDNGIQFNAFQQNNVSDKDKFNAWLSQMKQTNHWVINKNGVKHDNFYDGLKNGMIHIFDENGQPIDNVEILQTYNKEQKAVGSINDLFKKYNLKPSEKNLDLLEELVQLEQLQTEQLQHVFYSTFQNEFQNDFRTNMINIIQASIDPVTQQPVGFIKDNEGKTISSAELRKITSNTNAITLMDDVLSDKPFYFVYNDKTYYIDASAAPEMLRLPSIQATQKANAEAYMARKQKIIDDYKRDIVQMRDDPENYFARPDVVQLLQAYNIVDQDGINYQELTKDEKEYLENITYIIINQAVGDELNGRSGQIKEFMNNINRSVEKYYLNWLGYDQFQMGQQNGTNEKERIAMLNGSK